MMPIHGDQATFNVNHLLRENITNSGYYKDLFHLRFFDEIKEEILLRVTHAEAWQNQAASIPSSMFCCLYRLMNMRLSENQLSQLMNSKESPYLRCTGFLYIRYCANPANLWTMLSRFLLDFEGKLLRSLSDRVFSSP